MKTIKGTYGKTLEIVKEKPFFNKTSPSHFSFRNSIRLSPTYSV